MNESNNEPVAWALWWEDNPDYFVDDYISTYREVVEDEFLPTVVGNPKVIPLYTHPQDKKKDEALRLALEALKLEDLACRYEKEQTPEHIAKAITLIEQALENK